MILKKNKNEQNSIILIAINEEDYETIQYLFDNRIVFGFYALQHFHNMTPDNPNYPLYSKVLERYPSVKAVGHINVNSAFVPQKGEEGEKLPL